EIAAHGNRVVAIEVPVEGPSLVGRYDLLRLARRLRRLRPRGLRASPELDRLELAGVVVLEREVLGSDEALEGLLRRDVVELHGERGLLAGGAEQIGAARLRQGVQYGADGGVTEIDGDLVV